MERLTTTQQVLIEQALHDSAMDAWRFAAICYGRGHDKLGDWYANKCQQMQQMYRLAMNRELPGY